MQIQTFSIVVGGKACDAKCPFCVAKMTGDRSIPEHIIADVNHLRRFDIACKLAVRAQATTAMLTGKGEPTLWPELIGTYLRQMTYRNGAFPLIELQTNGLGIASGRISKNRLLDWVCLGLTTVAISVVHWESSRNKEIYTPKKDYLDLEKTISLLHEVGLSVRLSTVLLKGYVDSPKTVSSMIDFAQNNKVEQLTLMPVSKPANCTDSVGGWVSDKELSQEGIKTLKQDLDSRGTPIMVLSHGAVVYDVGGQNVCLSNCLKPDPTDLHNMRNLIFFPDGHIRHRWTEDGSIIL
jgi:molybdenum cofactor biosynthesis enzyme MoaA